MAKMNLDVVQNFKWVPDLYGNRELPEAERMWLLLKDWPAKEQARLRALANSGDIEKALEAERDVDERINSSVLEIHNAMMNGPDGTEITIPDVATLRAKMGARFDTALVRALLYPMTEEELKKLQARFSG